MPKESVLNARNTEELTTYENLQTNLRDKLNVIKGKHNLTNNMIADMSGVAAGTVHGIFSGKISHPNFASIASILIACNVSIDEFCEHSVICASDLAPLTIETPTLSTEMRRVSREAIMEAAQDYICISTEERLSKDLEHVREFHRKERERLESAHEKELTRINTDHARELERIEKDHAKLCSRFETHTKWWRSVALSMLAIVIVIAGVFVWDVTHPKVGLIRYGANGTEIQWVTPTNETSTENYFEMC